MRMTRRQWLATGVAGMTAGQTMLGGWPAQRPIVLASETSQPERWEIGCFNRPWSRWSYDEALDGIRQAGFRATGLLGDHPGEAFLLPGATPEYLDRLKERIASRGLTAIVAWLRTAHNGPLAESIAAARQQIENAHRLGVRYLLTTGVDPPEQFDHFYRVKADAATYAEQQKMQIVVKPHGGCSASADELLRCVARVDRPNFRVWYDAGNVIHYTGKDPAVDVERVARLVSGFCAKDCAQQGGGVMLQFGSGKANFAAVLARLKAAGFQGPVMVECCGGSTLAEVTAGAQANREFLERVFRML